MAALSIAITLAIRIVLVLLFFPFSALDKILNFRGALSQAGEAVSDLAVAKALVFAGLFVEIVMSLGVLTGIADRLCAFILAGYCGVTALLWKQFWKPGDFWTSPGGRGRTLFWDFLKNFALAAGFLLITFGTNASSVRHFIAHPTLSSDPYRILTATDPAMNADPKPAVPYWHLWTDEQGISHQTRCELAEFNKAGIQPGAAPQWIGSKTRGNAIIFVTVLPSGWVGDWHENPEPQWIIPLSGRWFVESMDGHRVEMGPGEMSFGEDQKAQEVDGKKGHLSGAVGDAPAVLMIVQLEALPEGSSPCRFR